MYKVYGLKWRRLHEWFMNFVSSVSTFTKIPFVSHINAVDINADDFFVFFYDDEDR